MTFARVEEAVRAAAYFLGIPEGIPIEMSEETARGLLADLEEKEDEPA